MPLESIVTSRPFPPSHFVCGELDTISLENITIASGAGLIVDGTVAGIVTATGKWKIHDPAATDGTENAAGIIVDNHNATSAERIAAAVVRHAEVSSANLTWKTGITNEQKATALALLKTHGIIAR